MQLLTDHDRAFLRRRLKASLDAHRRRAAADRQRLDYTAADLAELAAGADRCPYCGAWLTPTTLALDHRVPPCRSGAYSLGNLAACCKACNEAKGLLTAAEFTQLLIVLDQFHPRARADVLARLRAGGEAVCVNPCRERTSNCAILHSWGRLCVQGAGGASGRGAARG